jgi:hypothetical protein
MKAEEIVMRLEGLGIAVSLNEDKVWLRPGSRVPSDLAEQVSAHKLEVIEYLKTRRRADAGRFKLKFPDGGNAAEEELKEIVYEIEVTGYVLLWSTELEDFVAFHSDEFDIKKIPPGFILYREDELRHLFGCLENELSLKALRLIHASKRDGARVIDNGKDESK